MKNLKSLMELNKIDLTKYKEISICGTKYDVVKKRNGYFFTLIYQSNSHSDYDLLVSKDHIMFKNTGLFVFDKNLQ